MWWNFNFDRSIYDWVDANPAQRKFVEGDKILETGHIVKCGKKYRKKYKRRYEFYGIGKKMDVDKMAGKKYSNIEFSGPKIKSNER